MSQAAPRYAKALFDIAQEQNNLEAVQAALVNLGSLIHDLPEFRHFLRNPLFSFQDRSTVLKALFEGKIPDIVCKFLLFITYKDRLNILKNIIEAFDGLYLVQTHQLRSCVTTAFPVNNDDKILINRCLQDKFRLQMITQWDLEPSLIGGFRIYAQGQIYDYSFKNQLNHFLQQTTQPV